MTNKFLRKKIAIIIAAVLTYTSSLFCTAAEVMPIMDVQTETAGEETTPPVTEIPSTETPSTEAPSTEAPSTEPPATEAPSTEPPATEAPSTESPATEAPSTEPPVTETLPTEPPATDAPSTETSNTEAPATETPKTQRPVKDPETLPETEHNAHKETEKEKKEEKKEDSRAEQNIAAIETYPYTQELAVSSASYPAPNITENTLMLYHFLREEMELNHAASCGVLANIQLESNFNTLAIGDSGSSYGICQWHLGRCTSLINYCSNNGLDYHTLAGQMSFMKSELSSSYPSVLSYIKSVPDTKQGAYDAAHYWCVYYESPSQTYARAAQRGNLAMNEYYDRDLEKEANEMLRKSSEEKETKTKSGTFKKVETNKRANLRKDASLDGEFIVTIPIGTAMNVLMQENDWSKVTYQGKTGYVNNNLLKDISDQQTEGKKDEKFADQELESSEDNEKKVKISETDSYRSIETTETDKAETESIFKSKRSVLTNTAAIVTGKTETGKMEEEAGKKHVVTNFRANLRKEPSINGEFIITIPVNKNLSVEEIINGWTKVTYQGNTGYVNSNLLSQ